MNNCCQQLNFELSSDLVTGGFILKDRIMYCSDAPGLGLKRIS